jgi:hypothetical protein
VFAQPVGLAAIVVRKPPGKMLWGGGEKVASIVADANRRSPQCKRRTT